MAMNDEETVALIVGGHTFGKTHGAAGAEYVGPEPEGAPIEEQGLGWKNTFGTGKGADTVTSGLEGAWTNEPTKWDNGFLDNLFKYDWELTTSPAGAKQWTPKNPAAQGTVPDAHDPSKRHAPMMLTTDLALKAGPDLRADRQALPRESRTSWPTRSPGRGTSCCTATWDRLPLPRPVGPRAAAVAGPRSRRRSRADRGAGHRRPQGQDPRRRDCPISQLVSTAWASAATFRGTDKRGGANGARIRLAPQKDWEVNDPAELAKVLQTLEADPAGLQQLAVRRQEGLAR